MIHPNGLGPVGPWLLAAVGLLVLLGGLAALGGSRAYRFLAGMRTAAGIHRAMLRRTPDFRG